MTYTYTHIRTYTRKRTHVHIPAMCKFTMSNRVSVIAHVLSLQMCVGVYLNQVSLLLSIWENDLFMDVLS